MRSQTSPPLSSPRDLNLKPRLWLFFAFRLPPISVFLNQKGAGWWRGGHFICKFTARVKEEASRHDSPGGDGGVMWRQISGLVSLKSDFSRSQRELMLRWLDYHGDQCCFPKLGSKLCFSQAKRGFFFLFPVNSKTRDDNAHTDL